MRHAHLGGGGTQLPARLHGDLAQHMAEHPDHRQLGAAEQQLAVVDAPFRVGLEPGRVEPGVAFVVPANEHPAVGVEVHRGRQQRRAIEQQRPDPPVGDAHHGDRVRRAEVDAQDVHGSHPTGAGHLVPARAAPRRGVPPRGPTPPAPWSPCGVVRRPGMSDMLTNPSPG
jgi:hypothetical protein